MADDFGKKRAKYRAAIIHDIGLTASARLVGYEIADKIHPRSGDAWPSQEWLAARLGLSARTVRTAGRELVEAGWFTAIIDGRGWRYEPNPTRWQNGGQTPEKLSGVDTGKICTNTGKSFPSTPEKKVPLSSIENQINNEPDAAPVPLRPSGGGVDFRGLAKRQGAPVFVFEGSEPWKAWLEYRKQNGLPPALPTRQQMIGGRARVGWDMPTMYPPGYSKAGAA